MRRLFVLLTLASCVACLLAAGLSLLVGQSMTEPELTYRRDFRLYTMAIPRRIEHPLVPLRAVNQFIWSPDGTRLALVVFDPPAARTDLYLSDGNGRGLRQVARLRNSEDAVLAWSADSRTLAYLDNTGEADKLMLVDMDSQPYPVVEGRSVESQPDWFGSTLAFASFQNNQWDIYLYDRDARQVTRLTDSAFTDESPLWSPDGSRIAFISRRTGLGDVYLMDADGGNLTRLSKTSSGDYNHIWSPDGTRIAYLSTLSVHVRSIQGDYHYFHYADDGQPIDVSWQDDDRLLLYAPRPFHIDLRAPDPIPRMAEINEGLAAHGLRIRASNFGVRDALLTVIDTGDNPVIQIRGDFFRHQWRP